MDAGLVVATFSHNGRSNFIVHLLDSTGQTTVFLVNEIGVVQGQSADGIRTAGNFVMDVDADGDWTVSLDQPHPTSAAGAPQSFAGRGNGISPFMQLGAGIITMRGTHDGRSNFIVHLRDLSGSIAAFFFNEIGSVNASKSASLRSSGIYFVEIEADGNWTIAMEQTTGAPGPTVTPTATRPPTLTATPTLTPTVTPTPSPVCTPRPRVTVNVARQGPDQFQVSINASGVNNQIRQLQFGAATNASISVSGQSGTGNFAVTLPAGTQDIVFSIRRVQPGQALQVPLVVTDGCGPWPTFVGAGTGV